MEILEHGYYYDNKTEYLKYSHLYDYTLQLYNAGYSTKSIAPQVNMTPEQVQNLADTYFPTIEEDETANSIYKLYGSHTLEEISSELGLDNDKVLKRIHLIKTGFYGENIRKLFVRRDLISMSDKTSEFIIGGIIVK